MADTNLPLNSVCYSRARAYNLSSFWIAKVIAACILFSFIYAHEVLKVCFEKSWYGKAKHKMRRGLGQISGIKVEGIS